MARPSDNALKYYNQDTSDDDNLQYVEAIHSHVGYSLVHKLWKHIYGGPGGYYREWSEINQRLFCKNNNFTMDQLQDVLKTCFEPGIAIFSEQMYKDHKIITSSGVQKRWHKIVCEAGRKNNTLRDEYRLIDLPAHIPPAIPQQNTPAKELPASNKDVNNNGGVVSGGIIGGGTTQSKVKESKRKKSNLLTQKSKVPKTPSAPEKPALPENGEDKGKQPEPYWQEIVKVWNDFVIEKFKEPPLFAGQDPKFLKSIIGKLKKRCAAKNEEWSQPNALQRFKSFLQYAFADAWLAKNFILKNLDTQFEKVGRDPKKTEQLSKQQEEPCSEKDLEFLYQRFHEPDFKFWSIQPTHFDFLHQRGLVEISPEMLDYARQLRIRDFVGSNQASDRRLAEAYELNKGPDQSPEVKADIPNLEKLAKRVCIKCYFEKLKSEGALNLRLIEKQ